MDNSSRSPIFFYFALCFLPRKKYSVLSGGSARGGGRSLFPSPPRQTNTASSRKVTIVGDQYACVGEISCIKHQNISVYPIRSSIKRCAKPFSAWLLVYLLVWRSVGLDVDIPRLFQHRVWSANIPRGWRARKVAVKGLSGQPDSGKVLAYHDRSKWRNPLASDVGTFFMFVRSSLEAEYISTGYGWQSCWWSAEEVIYLFISLSPFAPPENLAPRHAGSAVPSRVSSLILHTQAESDWLALTRRIPPAFRDGVRCP